MYCICCKKDKVKPDQSNDGITEEDLIWKDKEKTINNTTRKLTINNQMVNGGVIHIIEAGYGSKYDGDRIIVAICDDCIEINIEDATLLYFGNYMYSDKAFVKEGVDESKKLYRRRKNLDNLTK